MKKLLSTLLRNRKMNWKGAHLNPASLLTEAIQLSRCRDGVVMLSSIKKKFRINIDNYFLGCFLFKKIIFEFAFASRSTICLAYWRSACHFQQISQEGAVWPFSCLHWLLKQLCSLDIFNYKLLDWGRPCRNSRSFRIERAADWVSLLPNLSSESWSQLWVQVPSSIFRPQSEFLEWVARSIHS